MTIDEARGHVGETVVHRFLDKPPEEAVIVKAGNHALHVRFAGRSEVVTSTRYITHSEASGAGGH